MSDVPDSQALPADDAALDTLWAPAQAPAIAPAPVISALLAQPVPDEAGLAEVAEARLGAALDDPRCRGRLALADQICRALSGAACLPPPLQRQLLDLRPALGACALLHTGWLLQPDHPVRDVLRQWLTLCTGWHPELGRAGEQPLRQWRDALLPLQDSADPGMWAQAATTLAGLQQQREQQRQRLDPRLQAAEEGPLRAARARTSAARQLNQRLGGRCLPTAVTELFHGPWFTALQQIWLRQGESSAQWAALLQVADELIWCLQPEALEEEHRGRFYDLAAELGGRLRQTADATGPGLLSEPLFAAVEVALLASLKNQPLPSEPVPLISNQDPWSGSQTHLSRHLLAALESVRPGDWFLGTDPPQPRLRLVCRLEDARQLLFANWLGVRAEALSFERFAYQRGGQTLLPLPDAGVVDVVIEKALAQQVALSAAEEQQVRERQRQDAARREAAEAARAQARARVQAEVDRRALAEAAAREAEEQALREQEQKSRQARQARLGADTASRERQARQQVSTLSIGSWLLLHDETGAERRMKLAVKLPSSGKLILVDREGRQRTELGAAELVTRLAEGSAVLLEAQAGFDDTLARVVDGLRRERGLSRREGDG